MATLPSGVSFSRIFPQQGTRPASQPEPSITTSSKLTEQSASSGWFSITLTLRLSGSGQPFWVHNSASFGVVAKKSSKDF
ncbi:MAG: hypothetical protein M1283_01085 [Gammaproteobacteria bacterium]|nr:hypothetical protein [Gammaproteobacteria bacterium]